ncbi:universal stress protein [Leisingera sp. ANG59]|uniref:universal stress protein n=1 Tax=Leisingera sp. ANG59 TaxID=2675221 RepID=UPI001571AB82|nr:universal stress protein [Leisingera sp. ANG59]NSY41636.1 universal stress protein [Leisingera sp. ANG59]
MYKNILVAVSFEEGHDPSASVRVAKALSGKDTKTYVLHVSERLPANAVSYMPAGYANKLRVAIQAELNNLAGQFKNGKGVVVEGHSGRTILDWAEANAIDCIVLDSHRPGLQDYFLGSTSSRVVRYAQCSVHVVRCP